MYQERIRKGRGGINLIRMLLIRVLVLLITIGVLYVFLVVARSTAAYTFHLLFLGSIALVMSIILTLLLRK